MQSLRETRTAVKGKIGKTALGVIEAGCRAGGICAYERKDRLRRYLSCMKFDLSKETFEEGAEFIKFRSLIL